MSTSAKHNQFLVTNATESTSIKHSLSERLQDSLQVNPSLATSQSLSLSAQNADMLMENSYQKKFNPLTDTYSGIHDYE